MARSRLDAIGRVWVLDAVLNFRDRFCSRLSYARYDEAVVGAEGKGEGKEFLTGNCDNVLFSPVGAGFAAIDSHVKLIREGGGVGAKKVAKGNTSELIERLHRELGRVLIEGTGRMEWLRFTVKVVGGWGLSDEALECVRVGAVRGMKAVKGAIEAVRVEIGKENGGEKWSKSMGRIDEEVLVEVGLVVEELVKGMTDDNGEVGEGEMLEGREGEEKVVVEDSAVVESAKKIGANLRLWGALTSELRRVLVDERVKGVEAGEHSNGEFWGIR